MGHFHKSNKINYYCCDSIIYAAEARSFLPRLEVHTESKTQETRKAANNQAVNFCRICAVDVPNTEDEESPPKEAPKPELLLS